MTDHPDLRDDPQGLPTVRAGELADASTSQPWLVDGIWTAGVGICGGQPKCAKSWFGLDMAVSVASGTPMLDRFQIHEPGPALAFLAEDALTQVRARIAALCAHRRIPLDSLDLHVITAPAVRLDTAADQQRLLATVRRLRPKLLVLDPLVRLHTCNENDSGEISALLGYLRELQRAHDVAILLVHHMSKRARPHLGQALRGSSDLHAWIDHGAYLTRSADTLRLTLEHRAAPAQNPIDLRLVAHDDGDGAHLEIVGASDAGSPTAESNGLRDAVVDALRRAARPLTRGELRGLLRVSNNRLGDVLADLEKKGSVVRSAQGLSLGV